MKVELLPSIGLNIAKILVPRSNVDMEKWSVVACDQFTSQPEYWEDVEKFVSEEPSTYHLILPEAYLGTKKGERHQAAVNDKMLQYIGKDIFEEVEGLILVEREIETGTRKGFMAILDLEKYDFQKDSASLIRATEGTITDRLPPRIAIRESAPLELPHIMVFIDDPGFTVIERTSKKKEGFETLYDFDLMKKGGHITGYRLPDEITMEIAESLHNLADLDLQKKKYNSRNLASPLLFAVGDGNHSLATAKSVWEKIKSSSKPSHPARFALVEIVNIHDPAIIFEPIHRLLQNVPENFPDQIHQFFKGGISINAFEDFSELKNAVDKQQSGKQSIGLITKNKSFVIEINHPPHTLPVGSLQFFLDDLLKNESKVEIDYIHGEETIQELSRVDGNVGFFLPAMDKGLLFESVIKDGPLPRKTFSMGEAHQKRYYLECRRIK